MDGYAEFQRIMSEINRKKELDKLCKEGKFSENMTGFGDLFGGLFNFY